MVVRVEIGLDYDGKWFANLVDLPGCIGRGYSPRSAISDALELAGEAFELHLHEELEFDIRSRGDA